jgi:hypothetical protein
MPLRLAFASFIVLAVVALSPGVCHADPSREMEKTWYGWQTLATDVAAQAITFARAGEDDGARSQRFTSELGREPIGVAILVAGGPPFRTFFDVVEGHRPEWIGLGTYVLAAPLVHLVHGRPKMALYSLGVRVLAPVGAGLGGALIGGVGGAGIDVLSGDDGDVSAKAIFGALGGMFGLCAGYLGAVALDAGMLSVEERPRAAGELRLSSVFHRRPGGGVVAIAGTF